MLYCKCFVISKVWKFVFFKLELILIFLFTKVKKDDKYTKSYTEEAVKEAIHIIQNGTTYSC